MKWSIRSLRTYMTARHGAEASNELFHNIQNLIIRCLLAVQVKGGQDEGYGEEVFHNIQNLIRRLIPTQARMECYKALDSQIVFVVPKFDLTCLSSPTQLTRVK